VNEAFPAIIIERREGTEGFPMYRVGIKRQFNAAHALEGYDGKCARLHGHTWFVEAVFTSRELGRESMVLDFSAGREMLDRVIEPYDHRYLNEVWPFEELRPTAENVARVLYTELLKEIEHGSRPVDLEIVTVWESGETWASYGPE
jgi:6-pyruvoyltetrahydropterin/6-carboxytetrahydropterin synthase